MVNLVLIVSILILLVAKYIFSYRTTIVTTPSVYWITAGMLFFVSLCCFIYFSFFLPDQDGLRGYGSITWLLYAASVTGFIFVLFVPKEAGLGVLKYLSIFLLIPVLIMTVIAGLYIDESKRNVFYDDPKFRVQKKQLVMYLVTLPQLVVKHGITETYYSINSSYHLPQEKVISATLEIVAADSVNVIFYHKADSAKHIPNPLVAGVRIK